MGADESYRIHVVLPSISRIIGGDGRREESFYSCSNTLRKPGYSIRFCIASRRASESTL